MYARTTQGFNVRTAELAEGMVVTEDVHDPRGMLLIRGGTRLTQNTTERLARLAPDLLVTVTRSAA